MVVLERLFLFFAVIFFILFGFFLTIFPLGYITVADVNRILCNYLREWYSVLIGILILIWALLAIYSSLFTRKEKSIVKAGIHGDVDIAFSAIENIVRRVSKQVEGVSEVKPEVEVKGEALCLALQLVVNQDKSIPDVAEKTQKIVKEQVESLTGFAVESVKVSVKNVQQGLKQKNVRVV